MRPSHWETEVASKGQFVYYMKLINELDAEPGLSAYSVSDTPVLERLEADFDFMRQAHVQPAVSETMAERMPSPVASSM